MTSETGDRDTITRLFRVHAGRVLASLITKLGDFQLAEDCLQDAWLEATKRWPLEGIPNAPDAWLLTVARRRAIDQIRRNATREASSEQLKFAYQLESEWGADTMDSESAIPDERLRLIFTCCHPALRSEHQVALTLRTLCGLSTEEIAHAFLTPTATMAQRLVRAKRKIHQAGIPYRVPDAEQLPERLESVRSVIYLTFNEGYATHTGDRSIRDELCLEAIRLARLLHEQTNHPENAGLLALMLLHFSRRPARESDTSAYIPLDEQDRRQWNDLQAKEGKEILLAALAKRRPGPYQIQAAISAVHSDSKQTGNTDWNQITGLYQALLEHLDTPVVRLNYAISMARSVSLEQGLKMLNELSNELDDYQPFHAAKANMLQRAGRMADAVQSYDSAIFLSTNLAEKSFLREQRRLCMTGLEVRDAKPADVAVQGTLKSPIGVQTDS